MRVAITEKITKNKLISQGQNERIFQIHTLRGKYRKLAISSEAFAIKKQAEIEMEIKKS